MSRFGTPDEIGGVGKRGRAMSLADATPGTRTEVLRGIGGYELLELVGGGGGAGV